MRGPGNLCLTLLVVIAAGCGSAPGPEGYLPTPVEAGSRPFGGWIELRTSPQEGAVGPRGELLAASTDTLWILGSEEVWLIPTEAVLGGELTGYDPEAGQVGLIAFLGTLSTVSNGGFLVFTAPAWILTGILGSRGQANLPTIELPPTNWLELVPFSRFPQGFPEGLDPEQLVGTRGEAGWASHHHSDPPADPPLDPVIIGKQGLQLVQIVDPLRQTGDDQ